MKEFVGPSKPKAVIWFYCEGNDTIQLSGEPKGIPFLARYVNYPAYRQNLTGKQPEVDRYLSTSLDLKMRKMPVRDKEQKRMASLNSIYNILQLGNTYVGIKNTQRTFSSRHGLNDEDSAHLYRLLRDSRDYIHSWRGELTFVYLPTWERYGKPAYDFNRRPVIKFHDDIVAIANSLDIRVIDVKEAFDAHPDPLSLWPGRVQGHYNADGYRVVAETILQAIQLPR
jgi:hypothetical protein